jgi:serine/threonine protein kinase
MLSRENRILAELIVSHGLATPEAVEGRAREVERSTERDLVEALVRHGELDPSAGHALREEARDIEALLRTELPEGNALGEYRLLREIGRGGMGIVYEAEQASLGRRVALKVLPAGAALDEQLAIRFLREARTAARLSHPGIVPVFGTGREQGVLFYAMELVEGETLARRI